MTEPLITVNGIELSVSQCMAVRVAIADFALHLNDPNYLGKDEHGWTVTRLYKARLAEVALIMQRNANAPDGVR